MVIAITGHTSGIGKALVEHFQSTHTVLGYSRANGYDLENENIRKDLISEISEKADVFINNAYTPRYRNAQLDLLQGIFSRWKDKDKLIIVNSSLAPNFEKWNQPVEKMKDYTQSKRELIDQCEKYFWDYQSKCRVVNVKLGLVDTPLVQDMTAPKMDPQLIGPYFNLAIENKFLRELVVKCI